MFQKIINKVRNSIRTKNYDMTFHAVEQMAEDRLGIFDVESAALNGKIVKREKDDPRGTKYTMEGIGTDRITPVGIVGRFKETEVFLIITVYKIT